MVLAAGSAAADDWSFSSDTSDGDRRCFAEPGTQTGSTRLRLVKDDAGLSLEAGDASWSLTPGTAFRSAVAFGEDPAEPVVADVLSPTVFRVVLSEAANGEQRARTVNRLAVERGDQSAPTLLVLRSNSMVFAIDELDDCRARTDASEFGGPAPDSGTMSADLVNYIETVFGEEMDVAASNDEAMLLESKTLTIFLDRRSGGRSTEEGRARVSELIESTFPDCDIPAGQRDEFGHLLFDFDVSGPKRWTASAVFDCLGKDLVVAAASGTTFLNTSIAINHGNRRQLPGIVQKLEVASLLQ